MSEAVTPSVEHAHPGPAEYIKVAVFLASSDSGWLTGEIMLASGGQR